MRAIEDILKFRGDISPFLVHLTKRTQDRSAADVLRAIIAGRRITPGSGEVSDLRFGGNDIRAEERDRFFGATCFTETPLGEVHCLLEINYRQINLEPYGLVLMKNRLIAQEVSPVYYLNNYGGDKDPLARALYQMAHDSPGVAEKLLPLFSLFGRKLVAPGAQAQPGRVDFLWEREWRQPQYRGGVQIDEENVFVGLCPHDEIGEFEADFPRVKFIDPMRPLKWYATELIHSRQRLDLSVSVV